MSLKFTESTTKNFAEVFEYLSNIWIEK